MADGFARVPVHHADGIYLDLPMWDYLRDDAISGSGSKLLAASPCDWRWERPTNALYRPPERDALARGTMVHKAVLEGWDAFDRAYCVRPSKDDYDGVVDTVEDIREWLRPHKEADPKGVKLTGARADLIERARAIAETSGATFHLWEDIVESLVGDRQVVSAETMDYVRLAEGFARRAYGHLLDGLTEVSIFWTDEGVRFKARLDCMSAGRIVDVKTFGQPPRLNDSLRQHLVNEATKLGYPIQAVMHLRAARAAAAAIDSDAAFEVRASGAGASERIARATDIIHAWREEPPLFTWLFLRCPGPPMGKPLPFRPSDPMFAKAEETIEDAIANWRRFTEACDPDELWIDAQEEEEIDDMDWPGWGFRSAMEERG